MAAVIYSRSSSRAFLQHSFHTFSPLESKGTFHFELKFKIL